MKTPKPGDYPLEHLPGTTARDLRGLSDEDLLRFIGGWKEGHEHRLAGMRELARRDQAPAGRRARNALLISCASLAISAAGFIFAIVKG
jgi:hypothetical protein